MCGSALNSLCTAQIHFDPLGWLKSSERNSLLVIQRVTRPFLGRQALPGSRENPVAVACNVAARCFVWQRTRRLPRWLRILPVASPLRAGDCCANADGSSCIIVASEEKARAFSRKPVWIKGLGAATAPVNMAGRDQLTGLAVAIEAARQAYGREA